MRLDEAQLQEYLTLTAFHEKLEIIVLDTVDSTNRYLKDLSTQKEIVLCCAETQTQGRGRFQRTWFSPKADNIYCSIRWHFPKPNNALATLSLVIGLAILKTLNTMNIATDIHIKWPNDLLWQDKKLCGILIETMQHPITGINVIIGIGLNVNSDSQTHQSEHAPIKPWCSLYDITHKMHDRNHLIAQLLIHIEQYIARFQSQGFAAFRSEWQAVDHLYGKKVAILQGNREIQGVVQGINAQGELLIVDFNQEQWQIASGEASIISQN